MAPALLQFQYRQGQDTIYCSALLTRRRLLLDCAARFIEYADRESLAAILEFVEMKMNVIWVLVGVSKDPPERGRLLRLFSYVGFEVVRPEQQRLFPICANKVFLVYTMERRVADIKSFSKHTL